MAITDDEILNILITEKRKALEAEELKPIKDDFEVAWNQKISEFEAKKAAERAGLLRLKEYQRDQSYDLKATIPIVQEDLTKSL